jgi:hypothetical protein
MPHGTVVLSSIRRSRPTNEKLSFARRLRPAHELQPPVYEAIPAVDLNLLESGLDTSEAPEDMREEEGTGGPSETLPYVAWDDAKRLLGAVLWPVSCIAMPSGKSSFSAGKAWRLFVRCPGSAADTAFVTAERYRDIR